MKKITQILVLLTLFIFISSLAQTGIKSYQPYTENYLTTVEQNTLQVYSNKTPSFINSMAALGDIWVLSILTGNPYDYGSFPLVGPYDINVINTIPWVITASDFDGSGTIYGVDFTTFELIAIDPSTGTSNVVATVSGAPTGHTIDGLSWNPVNSTMYALSGIGTVSTIYTLNLSTGVLTTIGTTGNSRGVWIVIDNNGVAYIADLFTDELFTVNLINGNTTLIGPLGVNFEYSQEADIDTATNNLYMPGYQGGSTADMYIVDVTTGLATWLGPIVNGPELGVFAIEGPQVIINNFVCEDAIPIILGIRSSNDPANTEGGASNVCFTGATNAEWYSYTALNSGELTITSDLPGNAGIDTRLSVYNDDCNTLVCITSDDNSGTNNTSTVTFSIAIGNTYLIEWDDANNTDPFDFELLFEIDCPNPENFSVSNITETTASFSWDEVVNASIGYILSIFYEGDDPVTGTPVYTETFAQGITTGIATGLTPDTAYDAYITADCDSNVSDMSMIMFNTIILSITEIKESNLIYFPNPTSNMLFVKAKRPIDHIEVFNLLGEKIIDKNPNTFESTINFSFKSTGTYFLRTTIDNEVAIHKIVKK